MFVDVSGTFLSKYACFIPAEFSFPSVLMWLWWHDNVCMISMHDDMQGNRQKQLSKGIRDFSGLFLQNVVFLLFCYGAYIDRRLLLWFLGHMTEKCLLGYVTFKKIQWYKCIVKWSVQWIFTLSIFKMLLILLWNIHPFLHLFFPSFFLPRNS